ncbi:MAG TPA: hydroxysqualene dehydroxylase HpnE, partial [Acidimicrobiales bacterium]|nr:hydroxysqualene dehydroxylase HpnE [Acidimicrobiales bacterium]
MSGRPHVAVVGGGLAGLAAALECADAGARVTLVERRQRLGGLTWSFEHDGLRIDNGQHVFLRCCREYLSFLDRIGAGRDVTLQDRLDIPVVAPGRPGSAPKVGRLRRSGLPAPLQLAGSLLRYPHLPLARRLQLGRALNALRRLRLDDPRLDDVTFGDWLRAHGQSEAAVATVWDLITVPTVNLPAAEASLALAAMVFKTGLLEDAAAADIGWSRVPLGALHGERASAALAQAGVAVRLGARVESVRPVPGGGFAVGDLRVDAAVVALPHHEAAQVLPPGAVAHQSRLAELGDSSIVDVHLFFDRPVTRWPLMAAVRSPIQWVFDRTESSGLTTGQYLAVSISASDDLFAERPDALARRIGTALERLLPAARDARVVDSLVTKERRATFRAVPGTAPLRPVARTSLPGLSVAGAWTDTGWPATMEGAVRSGRAAAHELLVAL